MVTNLTQQTHKPACEQNWRKREGSEHISMLNLIENTCLWRHINKFSITLILARFVVLSKSNVQRVMVKARSVR